jgi:hypothetical protein
MPIQIQKSLGGASDRFHFMTRERFSMQMRPNHVTDSSKLGVIIVHYYILGLFCDPNIIANNKERCF